MTDRRPNILFFFTDDQRFDTVRALGYDHIATPSLDELVERGGWVFARRGDGYLALRSQHPYHWQDQPGEDRDREMLVPGRRNIWICELGRRAVDGPFEDFVGRIVAAKVTFGRGRVVYESPSQGRLEFGWRGPLLQRGKIVRLDGYPRYESPYARAPFPSGEIEVEHGGRWLRLRWDAARREASGVLVAGGRRGCRAARRSPARRCRRPCPAAAPSSVPPP